MMKIGNCTKTKLFFFPLDLNILDANILYSTDSFLFFGFWFLPHFLVFILVSNYKLQHL